MPQWGGEKDVSWDFLPVSEVDPCGRVVILVEVVTVVVGLGRCAAEFTCHAHHFICLGGLHLHVILGTTAAGGKLAGGESPPLWYVVYPPRYWDGGYEYAGAGGA